MGRVLTGIVLLLGVVFLVKGFVSDVKKHQKPPTQYIIRDDSRIDQDSSQITITNTNDFNWENPTFHIKEKFRYPHQGSIPPQGKINIPFDKFKTDEGEFFSKDNMENFELDIRTETMARARK